MVFQIKSIFYSLLIISFSFNSLAQTQNCLVCKFPMSSESTAAGQVDACNDLFGASCVGTDGKPKYQDASKKNSQDLSKPIREARNKTVQTMGYKDIDDAVKSKLKEAGFALKDPPDAKTWKNLIGEGDDNSSSSIDGIKKLYADVEQCDKDVKSLQTISYYSITDVAALKEVAGKFESFQKKYKEQSIKFYAKDIPNFISNHIGQKCSNLKFNSLSYKPEDNQETVKACENIFQLRRKAVDIFRAEGTDGYEKIAEQFVRDNILPELKYGSSSSSSSVTPSAPGTTPPEKTEAEKLRDKITTMNSSIANYCYGYSTTVERAGKKVVTDLMKTISKSKTTVESIIESVYSKQREKMAHDIFETARSDIQDLTRSFVKDTQKREEILNSYDNLKIFWMKKPDDAAYTKDKNGVTVLDESNTNITPIDETSSVFFDPDLSFFKTLNAFYIPSLSYGKIKVDEQVNLMPSFISMLDKNPYAFLSVVAHESGHKIGQMVSKINGYDLSSEYKDLLACYKDNKSLHLQDNQVDETLADYFSSEVLAREIQKLPSDKRKQALMSSMEPYCIFDDKVGSNYSITCTEDHPEVSLRVSGIFGANPSIRKVMGCEGDSPKFKTCGLKISILDAVDTNKSTSSPLSNSGSSADGKSAKGVK